jgi:hypothetical protein
MRPIIITLTLLVAAIAALPPVAAQAGAPPALMASASAVAPPPALDIGGHVIDSAFLDYFVANGGLERFGPPLTDALTDHELGLPVQYFAFARMERHGDGVLLTRLGALYAADRLAEPPFQWVAPEAPLAPGRAYMAASGHTLGGAFRWHFERSGGVALLGHPISEELYEPRPDGAPLLVQYFERARLSYHPGPDGADGEVRPTPLGAWLAERLVPAQQRAPGRPLGPLATATIAYPAGSASGANIELAASRLNGAVVEPGRAISFLAAIGEISTAAGYLPGPAVRGGEVVSDEVGGGVCTVATLLYRAAWAAGLPILERRGHSRWLAAFADRPGLDAAVATPGPDLRVLNDTGSRLYVAAAAQGGRATLTLWGRGDGRTATLAPPRLVEEAQIEVVNARVVRSAAGAVLRRERVVTRYER